MGTRGDVRDPSDPDAPAVGLARPRPPAATPNELARTLFSGLPNRYDLLVEALTLGQNRRWRRAMVDALAAGLPPAPPESTARLLDVATGTAGVAMQLAGRLDAAVIGADLSRAMLRRGLENLDAWRGSMTTRSIPGAGSGAAIELVAARAEELPFADRSFDGLTFTYLLRYVGDVEATLAELARVLKPGAPMASLDFLMPSAPARRSLWRVYTGAVLPIAGWLAGGEAWRRVGRFLGPNIAEHYRRHPVGQLVAAWERAGFERVGARPMSLGGGLVMWGRRSGGER